MNPDAPRIVVVGATGTFGERLARRLARWPDIVLVLAARRPAPLETLRTALVAQGAAARIETTVFDRDTPHTLMDLEAFAVVDCAGPFQASDYRLAEAALAAGAHYVDLADARDFVAGFADALDGKARAAGRLAVTGASSSPALTQAVLDDLTQDWRVIDRIEVGISAGASGARGSSVIRAILSWAGRPVRVFTGGRWKARPGGGLLRRRAMRGLGPRWLSLAETPDLDLTPARFHTRDEALFLAGHETAIAQLGLWLATWPVRLGWARGLTPLAGLAGLALGLIASLAPDRGGMIVTAEGVGPSGQRQRDRWSLWADPGAGPNMPALPAAAVLRGLTNGDNALAGARACVGLVTTADILAQADGLGVHTGHDQGWPDHLSLSRRLMGPAFERLPAPVRAIHDGQAPGLFQGRAKARGAGGLAALIRLVGDMPGPGRYPDLKVEIAPRPDAEDWVRRFGGRRFASRLADRPDIPGHFEERIGPLRFLFDVQVETSGFRWRPAGWRLGPLPLPSWLAPRIRARSFARDGVYRFSVLVAHPLAGVILAYAGRLS